VYPLHIEADLAKKRTDLSRYGRAFPVTGLRYQSHTFK
jgi:hypothetical protein